MRAASGDHSPLTATGPAVPDRHEMTRWQHLQLTGVRDFEFQDDRTSGEWRWTFSVDATWREAYGAVVDAVNRDPDRGGLLTALGKDGWELVQCVDWSREELSTKVPGIESKPWVRTLSVLSGLTYVFKRPVE